MKKLLIASTALVASAGFAAADVTLGGSANMGVKYSSAGFAGTPGTPNTVLHYEVDFDIKGSGTTDGGLTFGASVDVDQQIANATGNATAVQGITDPEVFISSEFGTLTVGGVDDAMDGFGIADIGFDGIGVDDDGESIKAGGTQQNVHYKVTFDAFTLIAAIHTVTLDSSVSLGYDFGDWDAAIGYANAGNGRAGRATSIDVNGKIGDITVGAFYSDGSDGLANGYGVDFTYTMGATKIIVAYGDTDAAGDAADYGIGAEYDLGGGAKLAGGVGSVDSNTVADFGINLTF
jgi:outer membrane protein OmpU